MNEPQTASEIMMQSTLPKEPDCVLPHADVQKFLLDVLAHANFPGSMSEFVSSVKALLKDAQIKSS